MRCRTEGYAGAWVCIAGRQQCESTPHVVCTLNTGLSRALPIAWPVPRRRSIRRAAPAANRYRLRLVGDGPMAALVARCSLIGMRCHRGLRASFSSGTSRVMMACKPPYSSRPNIALQDGLARSPRCRGSSPRPGTGVLRVALDHPARPSTTSPNGSDSSHLDCRGALRDPFGDDPVPDRWLGSGCWPPPGRRGFPPMGREGFPSQFAGFSLCGPVGRAS